MKIVFSICILTFFLCGCANVQWAREGTSQTQMQKDLKKCDYEARKATAGITNGIEAGYQQATLRQQCMEIEGYVVTKVEKP